MAVILVAPNSFNIVSASERTTAPATNLRLDEPAMVWRSASATGVTFIAQPVNGEAFDTICLVGSNLRASDTIKVTAGATLADVNNGTNLTFNQTKAAWTGTEPTNGALSFFTLPAPITSPFVRIDITSTGNPAGYVQASRLVIGKRVNHDGVSMGAEQTYEDSSVVEEGPGYTSVDRYNVRVGWKVTLDGIKDAAYYGNWFPFLRSVGKSRAFVFVPDDTSPYVQNQAVFCRVNSSPAKASFPGQDAGIVEFTVLSVS
jgi:hypothetical protein